MIDRERVLEELALALEWCSEDDNPRGSVSVKIFAVRKALELLKEQPQWVSAKDKPPERPDWYQVYAPDYCGGSSRGKELHKGVMFAKWNGKSWGIEKGYYNRPNIVIAWREIPEPPEGVKQDE